MLCFTTITCCLLLVFEVSNSVIEQDCFFIWFWSISVNDKPCHRVQSRWLTNASWSSEYVIEQHYFLQLWRNEHLRLPIWSSKARGKARGKASGRVLARHHKSFEVAQECDVALLLPFNCQRRTLAICFLKYKCKCLNTMNCWLPWRYQKEMFEQYYLSNCEGWALAIWLWGIKSNWVSNSIAFEVAK